MKRALRPLEAATAALARRDRSAADLAAYLEQHGVERHAALAAVERLEHAGYVDDERLASGRAAVLAERSQGDAAIRFDLEQRGLDQAAITTALASLEPEPERALALAEKHGRTPKTARRLLAKGFDPETVEGVIRGEA